MDNFTKTPLPHEDEPKDLTPMVYIASAWLTVFSIGITVAWWFFTRWAAGFQ